MAGLNNSNELPAQLEAIGDFGQNKTPVTIRPVWYKFFSSMSALLQHVVNGILTFTVDNAVTAAGATQGTATPLTMEWSVVTVATLNQGVKLQNFAPGVPQTVINKSGVTIKVYPPVGSQIDGLGVNAAYALATTKTQIFNQISNTQFEPTQLG